MFEHEGFTQYIVQWLTGTNCVQRPLVVFDGGQWVESDCSDMAISTKAATRLRRICGFWSQNVLNASSCIDSGSEAAFYFIFFPPPLMARERREEAHWVTKPVSKPRMGRGRRRRRLAACIGSSDSCESRMPWLDGSVRCWAQKPIKAQLCGHVPSGVIVRQREGGEQLEAPKWFTLSVRFWRKKETVSLNEPFFSFIILQCYSLYYTQYCCIDVMCGTACKPSLSNNAELTCNNVHIRLSTSPKVSNWQEGNAKNTGVSFDLLSQLGLKGTPSCFSWGFIAAVIERVTLLSNLTFLPSALVCHLLQISVKSPGRHIRHVLYLCFCFAPPLPPTHQGAPVVVSFPHFYQADPKYINAVDGLNPNKEEHETYLDLQPVGIVAGRRNLSGYQFYQLVTFYSFMVIESMAQWVIVVFCSLNFGESTCKKKAYHFDNTLLLLSILPSVKLYKRQYWRIC